jgi:hypothetical protein
VRAYTASLVDAVVLQCYSAVSQRLMSLALGGFRVCLSITHCAESLQLLSTLKSCESPLTDYSDSTRAVLSPARGALARAGTMLTRAASPSASADGAGRQAPLRVSHCKHDSSHGTRGMMLHSAPWIMLCRMLYFMLGERRSLPVSIGFGSDRQLLTALFLQRSLVL